MYMYMDVWIYLYITYIYIYIHKQPTTKLPLYALPRFPDSPYA